MIELRSSDCEANALTTMLEHHAGTLYIFSKIAKGAGARDVEAEAESWKLEAEAVKAVKFLWKRKRKHFEERSWNRKRTRKLLTF